MMGDQATAGMHHAGDDQSNQRHYQRRAQGDALQYTEKQQNAAGGETTDQQKARPQRQAVRQRNSQHQHAQRRSRHGARGRGIHQPVARHHLQYGAGDRQRRTGQNQRQGSRQPTGEQDLRDPVIRVGGQYIEQVQAAGADVQAAYCQNQHQGQQQQQPEGAGARRPRRRKTGISHALYLQQETPFPTGAGMGFRQRPFAGSIIAQRRRRTP